MSTGPSIQAASIVKGNQSQVELDASHSALFYLFQEVSKLTSPIHSSFLDTYQASKQLNTTSRTDPLVVCKEEQDAHSLFPVLLCDEMKKVKEESPSSNVTTFIEPHCDCNSPWKVLSLINLHCEKLLHQEDVAEMELSSVSSITKFSHSATKSSTADVTEGGVRNESLSAGCTLRPMCLSPMKDNTGDCTEDSYTLQCCVKEGQMGSSVQLQTTEKTDTDKVELLKDSLTAALQFQHKCKTEVKFNVNRQLKWNQEHKNNAPFSENSLLQTHIPEPCLNTQLAFNSNDEAWVALSKPVLTQDHNANLTLFIEPPCDTQLPPLSSVLPSSRSASLIFNTVESFHSPLKQDDNIPASNPEGTHAPKQEKSPAVAQLQSSSCNVSSATSKPELWTVKKEEIGLSSTHQWRTKTPRKQPHPSRSPDIQDPDFQGVTFRMDTELDDSREQCRLLITSKYSKELYKHVRKPRLRTRKKKKSLKISSSDEENDLTANVLKGKVCASCCTRKTPMWRDAEDGTPLCNACGIRYKKYRVRCVNCWHIPRKEGNSNSSCLKCGNFVRLTSAKRKHTT